MRNTLQLIRIAVGTAKAFIDPAKTTDPSGVFEVFNVKLPLPEFQGFPPEWTFAVLKRSAGKPSTQQLETILISARNIINRVQRTERLALLSDEPAVHLADEFLLMERAVVPIDATYLPAGEAATSSPRLAPLVLALQAKPLSSLAAMELLPYQRDKPVSGWRFFGRTREINELITANENFAVVGARRTGKTSLLQEVERQLKDRGEEVYYVDVQDYKTGNEVAGAILQEIAPGERFRIIRRKQEFKEKVLPIVLRRMAASPGRTTLLLDELGNVIRSEDEEDWKWFGSLRKFSQHGQLRIIFTCFQELFLQQERGFSGPLINFAHTMRLNLFSEAEVKDFVFSTLRFWRPVDERAEHSVMSVVLSNVGRHPLFLQYFCRALFESVVTRKDEALGSLANSMFRGNEFLTTFEPVVEEVFYRINSPTLQYLFLRRCHEAATANQELKTTVLDDEWLAGVFTEVAGSPFSLATRRRFLESLEIRGLCAPQGHDRRRQMVAVPLIYRYVKRVESSVDRLLVRLEREVTAELATSDMTDSQRQEVLK